MFTIYQSAESKIVPLYKNCKAQTVSQCKAQNLCRQLYPFSALQLGGCPQGKPLNPPISKISQRSTHVYTVLSQSTMMRQLASCDAMMKLAIANNCSVNAYQRHCNRQKSGRGASAPKNCQNQAQAKSSVGILNKKD